MFYASCVVVYLLSHVRLFCDPVTVVGSSVHGIFQARRLEWVAISFPGNYPDPGMVPMFPVYQGDSLPLSHLRAPILCQGHHQSTSSSEAQCQEPCNSWIGLQRGIWEGQWNLNGLLQKCLFLAQSHFSRWLGIPGSDINSVQSQFS